MSQRSYKVYINDILDSIRKIEGYIIDMTFEDFIKDDLVKDAVLRNLEVIGEAAKNIPDEL